MTTAQPGQEQRMLTEEMLHAGNIAAKGFLASSELVAIYTAMHAARPTADLGEDGELVEQLRTPSLVRGDAWTPCQQAADRLILYREVRDVLAELVETIEQAFPALALQPIMVRASALLSRSGDD